jgi:hypothetical protein
MTSPRDTMMNEDATATAVFEAAKRLLGPGFLAWEPESIWLELKDHGVDMDQTNRDKLMAASTLIQTGGFYWDAAAFENTTMAFNDLPIAPDAIQEASPAQLAWAVFEAELLLHREYQEPGEFDYEPARYAAVSMNRAGHIVAPESLAFAQEELDKLNQGNLDLKDKIKQRWENLDKSNLTELELAETPLDTQIGYLAACHLYVEGRARQLQRELDSLAS